MFEVGSTVKVSLHYKPRDSWNRDNLAMEDSDNPLFEAGKSREQLDLRVRLNEHGADRKILHHETVLNMLDDLRRKADKQAQLPPAGYAASHDGRFSLFNLEQREDFMNEFRKLLAFKQGNSPA